MYLKESALVQDGNALLHAAVVAVHATLDGILTDTDVALPKLEGDVIAVAETLVESFIPPVVRPVVMAIIAAGDLTAHAAVIANLGPVGHAFLMSAKVRLDAAFGAAEATL